MTHRTPPMTHATGSPVVDNTNIQTAGPRGPALLQVMEGAFQCSPMSDCF
jgi:catalase